MNHPQKSSMATFVGSLALLFWTCGSTLLSELNDIPTFQILSIGLTSSFLITCIKLTAQRRWALIRQVHWSLWAVGLMGLYGNDMLLVYAYKHAPYAHVHLINYLWPTYVILLTPLLPQERMEIRYVMASMVGFVGVYLLIKDEHVAGMSFDFFKGYLCALLAGIVWSIYIVYSRFKSETPSEMIGMYCGMGALISWVVHCRAESFVVPTVTQTGALFVIGTMTSCCAFYFWDYGSKKGNIKLLSLLSYINPLIGVALLSWLGRAHLSDTLVVAMLLIVGSPLITLLDLKSSYVSIKAKGRELAISCLQTLSFSNK